MSDELTPECASALLQSTQQLRLHWSGAMATHMGHIIVINVAIWGYLLKAYIDSFAEPSKNQPSFIILAAAISAILLGAWRLYTHYLDDKIAGLYPDFLLYESVLSTPFNHSTWGYLSREVPHVKSILSVVS